MCTCFWTLCVISHSSSFSWLLGFASNGVYSKNTFRIVVRKSYPDASRRELQMKFARWIPLYISSTSPLIKSATFFGFYFLFPRVDSSVFDIFTKMSPEPSASLFQELVHCFDTYCFWLILAVLLDFRGSLKFPSFSDFFSDVFHFLYPDLFISSPSLRGLVDGQLASWAS